MTTLKLLDGRIDAGEAYSLIQSELALTGSRAGLLLKLGLGLFAIQGATLFGVGFPGVIRAFPIEPLLSLFVAPGLGLLLVDRLVVRRIKSSRARLDQIANGEHQLRFDVTGDGIDELTDRREPERSPLKNKRHSVRRLRRIRRRPASGFAAPTGFGYAHRPRKTAPDDGPDHCARGSTDQRCWARHPCGL